MYGPQQKGTWSKSCSGINHGHLVSGKKYIVVREFQDFDRDTHPVNETWTFIGSSFAPHDDGLSLFVSLDGEHEWQIRMQWLPETQGEIINALESYIKEA